MNHRTLPRALRVCLPILAGGLLLSTAPGQEPTPAATATPEASPTPAAPAGPPESITFFPGTPTRSNQATAPVLGNVPGGGVFLPSPISAAVAVPGGQALLLTSGTVPPVLDDKAPPGSRERYGDTKTQGLGALRQIEAQLKKAGLGLQDVIYLRVYVAADKAKEGRFDFPGWFEAYGQFFNTADNPVKPARSTVGVAALVNPDWLIEIEAVAAYPAKASAAPADH